jgi:RNA polymerase sigma factor (sigma-70 family)
VNDWELLREYVRTGSQPAFAQLVERHVRWIHATCARQTRDPHLAEDVTQAVFLLLWQKAARLKPGMSIAGWLFRTARLTSANAMKMERRRTRREAAAAVAERSRQDLTAGTGGRKESELLDALDRAMSRLRPQDRDVLVLRFYNSKSVSEAAVEMGVSLEAAKKRFARSLDALRQALAAQGVAVPAAGVAMAIITAMGSQTSQAVPAALGNWVAGGASPEALSAKAVEIVRWMGLRRILLASSFSIAVVLMMGVIVAVASATRSSTIAPVAATRPAPSPPAAVVVASPAPPVRVTSGPTTRRLQGHSTWVIAAAMSPDARYAVSRSSNQLLRWDLQTGAAVGQPVTIREQPFGIAVSNAGKIVAVDRPDLLVFETFDVATPRRLPPSDRRVMHWSLAISPDGSRVAAGGADGVIRLIDLAGGEEVRALHGDAGVVGAVAFSPDGETLLSGGWDHAARVWDLASGNELHRLAGHTSAVHAVAFSPDGRLGATFARSMTGSKGKSVADKFVRVWNLQTGRQKIELPVATDNVQAAAFSPDGRRIAALVARDLLVWELADGSLVEQHTVLPDTAVPTSAAFSSDLNHLLVGGDGPQRKDLLFLVP